jgi:hypothetical protein
MLDMRPDFLYELDARGACANMSHALVLEIHAILWPYSGVVDVASEV